MKRQRPKPGAGTAHIARRGHHRNPRHRGMIESDGGWVPAPPSKISILRVSKEVSIEASQVLYGCNTFHFEDSTVFLGFMSRINDCKQYLRHVSIGYSNQVLVANSWASTDRIVAALVDIPGLRTLEVQQSAFPTGWSLVPVTVPVFVRHFTPLLAALKAAIESWNLKHSVLDVIKIARDPPSSYHRCPESGKECYTCTRKAKEHEELEAEMEKEITKQLRLKSG